MEYKIEDYYDGSDQRPEGAFRISPSGLHDFFDKKTQWYKENLLGEPKAFTGSTATLRGTIVHFAAEMVTNCKLQKEPYDSEALHIEVERYLQTYEEKEGYDVEEVRSTWHGMAEPLITEYVLQANTLVTELYMQHELLDGIYVAGTADAITSTVPNDDLYKPAGQLTLRDFKTSKSKPSSFSYAYRLQALAYCYVLHQQGIKINNMELCFTVAPTKTLPVRTFNFVVPFDDGAYKFIEGILYLMADSIQAFKAKPEWRYLLACDYRLKVT